MSRGILIYAHNNPEVDYGLIAYCNALMIRTNMPGVPICLVTDEGTLSWLRKQRGAAAVKKAFDEIVIEDYQHLGTGARDRRYYDTLSTPKMLPWHNGTRPSAYQHSPFDETLLIDADYLIQNDRLNLVWGAADEVMINRRARTLDHLEPEMPERFLNPFGIAMYWATVVYFRKSNTAETLFDMVAHVKENYDFYAYLYGFPARLYRNDFSFSIAVHTMGGFIEDNGVASLPCDTLLTSFDTDELIDVPARNELVFLVNDAKERYRFHLARTKTLNVHVMNKFSIARHAAKIVELYQ